MVEKENCDCMKLENWSPGYALTKPLVGVIHRFVHRKYEVVGKENLKGGDPIIFAPNHQNALNDALVVLFATPFQPVWLARADIFSSKLVAAILHFIKISPVYRIRDGKETLSKNQEVFEMAIRVLKNNRQLALFPEATHSGKRQAIIHKKAVPRIAFMAGEQTEFKLPIKIVPTGIYYSHYYEFDRNVLVNFGPPIYLKDYQKLFEESPLEATNKLRKDLNDAVLGITFNIPSKDHYEAYEFLRDLIGREQGIEKPSTNRSVWKSIQRDQAIVDQIYKNEQAQSTAFNQLISLQKNYAKLLNENQLSDRVVAKGVKASVTLGVEFLGLILGSPFALLGYVTHYFLYAFPLKKIKGKIKEEAFWGSFLFVLAMLGGMLLYLLYGVILSMVFHSWIITLAGLVTIAITAKIAWRWNKAWQRLSQHLRFKKLVKTGVADKISSTRKDILETFNGMQN